MQLNKQKHRKERLKRGVNLTPFIFEAKSVLKKRT
jgi:hypothetical protein